MALRQRIDRHRSVLPVIQPVEDREASGENGQFFVGVPFVFRDEGGLEDRLEEVVLRNMVVYLEGGGDIIEVQRVLRSAVGKVRGVGGVFEGAREAWSGEGRNRK